MGQHVCGTSYCASVFCAISRLPLAHSFLVKSKKKKFPFNQPANVTEKCVNTFAVSHVYTKKK